MDRSRILRLALKLGIALKDSELDSLSDAIKSIRSEREQYEYIQSVLLLQKQSIDLRINRKG